MRRSILAFLLMAVIPMLVPYISRAACHVVTPAGSGTKSGNDWTNAFAGLPATLVRGDIYYLADGTYSDYTFSTAESGSTLITIKKAISSDHCTDTGWVLGTMGSGQAIFLASNGFGTGLAIRKNFFTIDGQGGAGEGTTPYGIVIDSHICGQGGAGFCRDLAIGDAGAVTDIVVKHIEVKGFCTGISVAACTTKLNQPVDDSALYFVGQRLTVQNVWMHDFGSTTFVGGGTSDIIFDHVFLQHNNSNAITHENGINTSGNVDRFTIRYSSFHDIQGTGHITALNSGTAASLDAWQIYGNYFWWTTGVDHGAGTSNLIGCINGNNCTNWKIYNNTIQNIGGGGATGTTGIWWQNGATGSVEIRDNIWLGNLLTPIHLLPSAVAVTEDHNSCLNELDCTSFTGTADVSVTSGVPNPFVDSTNGNFHLVNETNQGVGNGMAFAFPFNTDPDGNVRCSDGTCERGAFEFATGSTLAPPTQLKVTSVQ